jgi:hypothetical protein
MKNDRQHLFKPLELNDVKRPGAIAPVGVFSVQTMEPNRLYFFAPCRK